MRLQINAIIVGLCRRRIMPADTGQVGILLKTAGV